MKTKNEVHLTGGIVSIHSSKSVALLTIGTTVAGVSSAYPTIVFYDPSMIDGFKVGDRISIDAHIQLRPIRDENGKPTDYHQDYVGDRICKASRMLAPFLDDPSISKYDGGIKSDENIAYIFGKIRHIYIPNDNVVLLSIVVPRDEKHLDYCEVACFRRQAQFAKMLSEDDCVMIGGVVQTKRLRNGSNNMTQNIACRDILKCDGFEDF